MTPDIQAAAERIRAFLDERGPERHNVIATAGPRAARYAKPRLRADDLRLLLAALDIPTQDDHRPRAPYGRGQCPTCDGTFNLTKGGALRHHSGDTCIGGIRQICNGTGQPPHPTSTDDGHRDPDEQPIPHVPTQAGIDYLAIRREQYPKETQQ